MKQVFFASDFHLGIDADTSSRERERRLVQWLDAIAPEADHIFLVGDLFDHWFEYRSVVPRGFVRFLGKLAELRDRGIPIEAFTGNHDMWMFGYLEEELGIPVHREPIEREFEGKRFFIGHGDGLGPGDHGYKALKKVLANPLCQWLFARIHPDTGIALMRWFSTRSRAATGGEEKFLGNDREWLVQFCEERIRERSYDYFVFGHRHLPLDITLSDGRTRYVNLGDWLQYDTYARFDGEELRLENWKGKGN